MKARFEYRDPVPVPAPVSITGVASGTLRGAQVGDVNNPRVVPGVMFLSGC